ncbi:hypothetical protein [Gilvimarinus japonicus]|uniref:Uncharacterized protein n=1 Tax=Gilvimarinus japonicus TaxID=1796469 RepID=A0ABV7HRR4_9GAMM
MTLSNKFKTDFIASKHGNRVDIDPIICDEGALFHPMISVVEFTDKGTQKLSVTVNGNYNLNAEKARKVGLVLEAAGRLCAMAEDHGSLQRAWFYSFCKPRLVAVNNQSTALH